MLFTIGAYAGIMMYLSVKLSPWISMFIGIIAACLFALVIGAPCFRLRGVFFSIATISCTTILRQCLIVFKNVTGGSVGLNFGIRKNYSLWMLTFKSKIDFYYIALIWMLICVAIFVFVKRSRLGYYLRAVREDEDAASSLGIVPSSLKTKAFLISASMMAVTGTLYVFRLGYVDPNALCAHDISVKIGLIAILGGMGTPGGQYWVPSSSFRCWSYAIIICRTSPAAAPGYALLWLVDRADCVAASLRIDHAGGCDS